MHLCTPCEKTKTKDTIECTLQTQCKFWRMHWIALLFLDGGRQVFSNNLFFQKHRLRIQACFFLSCCSLALDPRKRWQIPGYFDSRAEMSVRVRKGCFMVETPWRYNFGPNVVLSRAHYWRRDLDLCNTSSIITIQERTTIAKHNGLLPRITFFRFVH